MSSIRSQPRGLVDVGIPEELARDSRWQIVGELGAGGMGTVYEAIDRRTGERVALKLLGELGAGLLRFKNEFRLAARLSHPSLVTLYELVQVGDVAWFTMELVDGVELRHWVRGRDGTCDLERLYRALAQLLDALACLGDAGVVHRDLKPSNVLVSATGALKLLDFGLASARDTADFQAAMAAGTPIYMAPEQITEGAPVGPPADLYALGVIVYELLVGDPPFLGGNRTLFRAHRHHAPKGPFARGARVRALGPDGKAELARVPAGLEWWCLRLLEKRACDRFPNARVARDALAAVEPDFQRTIAAAAAARRAERANRRTAPVPSSPPAPDVATALLPIEARLTAAAAIDSGPITVAPSPAASRSRGAPAGREAEWTRLLQLLHAHSAGSPARIVVLDGESGVGKSHLASAFAAEARRRGAVVLRGACREREAVPYNAFDAAIDEAATHAERLLRRNTLSRTEREAILGDIRLLRPIFPVLRELDDGNTAPGHQRRDATPSSTIGEGGAGARARAFDALARLAARVTFLRPLVLVVDDLHWADADSLALLARLLETQGLFVVATAQPGFALPPSVVDEARVERLPLLPLDRRALARLVVEAGASAIADDAILLQHLHAESGGNPYLLLELVRLARAGERNRPRPRLADVVARRLASLDDDERALLELAAVGPQPASGALLARALGAASRPMALEGHALRRLVSMRLLVESGARAGSLEGVRYEVPHHRLRTAILSELPPERRRKLHLRLAEALEDTLARGLGATSSSPDVERTDALAEALVVQLREAGEPMRAAAHAERAAEAAMARLAHARAVELYGVALEQAGAADAVRLRIRRGQALAALARFAEASADFAAALSSTLVGGLDRTVVELHHASCLMHEGDLDASERIVERALARLGATPRRRPFAGLVVVFALVAALVGQRLGRAVASLVGRRRRRRVDPSVGRDPRDAARLLAWSLWVPHCQYGGRTLDQLEASLRHRLLAARVGNGEEVLEAEALAIIPLLPFEHLPGGRRAVERGLVRLQARTSMATTARGRAWLPLLRAMRELLAGRPHAALVRFDELARLPLAEGGYVALQQRNALLLAGRYDRLLSTSTGGPLADVRAAYIAALRGDLSTARAALARAHLVDPGRLPWTERLLFVYHQVETLLLLGHVAEALPLARSVRARVRRTAISPLTGAFESLDALVRALVSEARRAEAHGDRTRARRLLAEAASALARAPLVAPPLFHARLLHDRAVLALARADLERRPSLRARALALLDRAERETRGGHIPCLRLRLCLDFVALLPADEPRRDAFLADARAIAERGRLDLASLHHPWLAPAEQRALELVLVPEVSGALALVPDHAGEADERATDPEMVADDSETMPVRRLDGTPRPGARRAARPSSPTAAPPPAHGGGASRRGPRPRGA